MKNIIDLKKKRGFYFTITAWFLFLVGFIGYILFSNNQGKGYFSLPLLIISIVVLIVLVPLFFIKYTERYSPILLTAASLGVLLAFIKKSYMYFSVVFYSGIDIKLLFTNDFGFPLALIGFLLSFLVGSVSIYLPQGCDEFVAKPFNKPLKIVSKVKTITQIFVHVLIFGAVVISTAFPILMDNKTSITTALGQSTFIKIEYDDGLDVDTNYFTSSLNSVKDMKKKSAEIIQKTVENGAVLLKNDNNALPIQKGKTISFFSTSSVDLINGRGSSSEIDEPKATLKDGAIASGLNVNESLWNWYVSNLSSYGRKNENDRFNMIFTLNDANWETLPSSKTEGDVGILVISRDAGEGVDPQYYGGAPTKNNSGNYLELSNVEKNLLQNIKNQFGKVIVILNCANELQIDFDADAILWIGNIGSAGAYGVGNILSGDVNPSGHASDTFWRKHFYNPVLANFGATPYSNRVVPQLNEITAYCPETTEEMINKSNNYTVYQEGIYNGYRYTETRYEDYVLGRNNVGEFSYSDVVAYPFGYGDSYTDFSYSNVVTTKQEKDGVVNYEISVDVTNTGDIKGKDAVQVYLQKPYTEYDITNHIEKASVELVGFEKTGDIEPGKTKNIKVQVPEEFFESYDAYGAKTYILDEGNYYLTVAHDAHDAINNILDKKGLTNEQQEKLVGQGNKELVNTLSYAFDRETYSVSLVTGVDIVNQFDNADMNIYEGKGSNSVTYISRNNWQDTVVYGVDTSGNKLNNQTMFVGTDKMKEDIKNPTISEDDIDYPTYGSRATSYSIVDFMDEQIPFDSPMWDEFLDQLTWTDMVSLLSSAERSTGALTNANKPETLDYNGAIGPNYYNYRNKAVNGIAYKNGDPDKDKQPNQYPNNGIVASTFDKELINEYGKVMGEDCLWCGYSGLYGPALNIHRSAFGGRAFEYYSEDPILTGLIASAQIQGIQSFGIYCYVKHCILNDAEIMREGINIWANEQTIREIYLRPFELAIRYGGAPNVMSGFNRIGLLWNGHQGYMKKVLHGEFGMKGFAVSDWYDNRTWYITSYGGLLNGNDMPDGSYAASKNARCLLDNYKTNYGELAWAMRDACHRILYIVAHSNAMNGLSSNVEVYTIVPMWIRITKRSRNAINTSLTIIGSIFGAILIGYYVLFFISKKNRGANKNE